MPVNTNRHGSAEYEAIAGEPPMRLQGDPGGDIDWQCTNCDTQQRGRPESGCTACGAGKPGFKPATPQPSYEEMQQGMTELPPTVPATMPASKPLGLAQQMLAAQRAPQAPQAFEALRQIVREELRAVLSPMPAFNPAEKTAILEGLQFIEGFMAAGNVPEDMATQLPDVEGLQALRKRIEEA